MGINEAQAANRSDLDADYPAANIEGRVVMHSELQEAFEMVENPFHWKDVIDATIEWPGRSTHLVIMEAIRYFTATEPKAEPQNFVVEGDRSEVETIRYTADGYWRGPAA